MSRDKGVRHELSIPAGPVRAKYRDFVFNESFKEMAMVGTFNCLGAATRIYDAELGEHVAVGALFESGRAPVVLARSGGSVVPVRATVPFAKGRGAIYRFGLASGASFEATLGHSVLSGGRFRRLQEVLGDPSGAGIARVEPESLLPSSWGDASLSSRRDALRWMRRVAGSPADYWLGRRLYGERPLLGPKRGPVSAPSRAGALSRSRGWRRGGGLVGESSSSACLVPALLASCGASGLAGHLWGPAAALPSASWLSVGLGGSSPRLSERESRDWSALERRVLGYVHGEGRTHYASPCVEDTITSVELVRHDVYYDLGVPGLHNYLAEGVFHHNSAKSTALVDWLITSGIEYPGANLVLTRAKLSDLRRTTLTKFLARAGNVLVDDYNKNEAVIEFPAINGKVSKLYMFGLDRTDLDEVLKSFEPFRAAVEEANEVPSRALDLLLGRLRQKVEHRHRTWEWYVGEMAVQWGVSERRAMEMLGLKKEQLLEPHLGANQLKYVFNPEGNDTIWRRCVGVPYPPPEEFSRDWVHQNVGVREFVIPPKEIGSYTFQAGNLVELAGGKRAFAAGEGLNPQGEKVVELADGSFVSKNEVSFVGQRAAIFAFTDENWSRNIKSDENFLYMQDPAIREQYFEGKIDVRKGLVLPGFDRGSHVAPPPKTGIPKGLRVLVGVDQGFRHPTVALFAVETRKPAGGLFIFKEYVAAGRPASENAYLIRGMIPEGVSSVQYWADPSMWVIDATSGRSVADDYTTAGVPLLRAENALERTIDGVRDMLRMQVDWRSGDATPMLFVSSECEQLIHAMESCTTQHMTSSRDNWIVDVMDALRYLVSGASRLTVPDAVVPRGQQARPRVWDY